MNGDDSVISWIVFKILYVFYFIFFHLFDLHYITVRLANTQRVTYTFATSIVLIQY